MTDKHCAPPVSVTLSDFRAWRGGIVLLGVLCLGALLAWAWQAVAAWGWPDAWPRCVGAVALSGVALIFLGQSWHLRPTRLSWDGQTWRWTALDASGLRPDSSGEVRVVMDLGAWLLLRVQAHPRPHLAGGRISRLLSKLGGSGSPTSFLPATQASLGGLWHPLRCALYSPAPRGAHPSS